MERPLPPAARDVPSRELLAGFDEPTANSVAIVGLQLLVQRNATHALGQAFGIVSSVSLGMGALGFLSAGIAAELWGARVVWVIGGALIVAAAVAVTALARADEPVAVAA